jgi:hypothetical protein
MRIIQRKFYDCPELCLSWQGCNGALLLCRMQNILRHLGSGFEVFASALDGGGSRLKNLITMIKSENVGDQMTGLSELCEYISVSPEEAMITFPTEQVVPILLELLHGSPDIMLLSSRAITLLVDVYPPSAKHVARHGGVRILCEKLLCIEYIDLAEQSIQALGKISQYCPEALLKDSALEAVLSYIDFFQVGLQRVAVATAANICGAFKNTSSKDALPSIQSVVPTVVQLSSSSDNKISLSACQALTSIAAWCNKQDEPVESIIQLDYFQQFVERVSHTLRLQIFLMNSDYILSVFIADEEWWARNETMHLLLSCDIAD